MTTLLAGLQSFAAIVFTFGLIIILHEWGHFFACRKLGVKVERFSFGFGPELLGYTGKTGTRFSWCLIPLGGYIKPSGDRIDNSSGALDEFTTQKWYKRLIIAVAGPVMNYVLAFALFAGISWVKGSPTDSTAPQIGGIVSGYPADRAGLKAGDIVTAINDNPVDSWGDLVTWIMVFPNQSLRLRYSRSGQPPREVVLVPQPDSRSGDGVIGITPVVVWTPVSLPSALRGGLLQCQLLTAFTISSIVDGLVHKKHLDLAGPVGLTQVISKTSRVGWESFFFLIGLLSLSVGFMNLLPVPLLDGGHMAICLWEGLSGRKLSREATTCANLVGIAFLVLLMLGATYSDLSRLKKQYSSQAAQQTIP